MKKIPKPAWIVIVGFIVYIPLWFGTIHLSHEAQARHLDADLILPINGGDSSEYAVLAENLLAYHSFTLGTPGTATGLPETFRTAGYPLFVAAFLFLFNSYFAATFVQILLVIGSALLIYAMGRRLFSPAAGLIAALAFIIDPTVILHTLVILSDIPFVFLVVLVIYLLFFAAADAITACTAGVVLGMAVLVRPIAIYAAVPLLIFYWLVSRSKVSAHDPSTTHASAKKHSAYSLSAWLRGAILFLCGVAVIVLPWMLRNKMETGVFGLSSVTAYNLYHYNVPGFLEWKGMSPDAAQALMASLTGVDDAGSRLIQNSVRIMPAMEQVILTHPLEYAEYHWIGGVPFIASSGLVLIDAANSGAYEHMLYPGRMPKIFFIAEAGAWVFIFALACGTLYRRRRDVLIWLLFLAIFYFWLLTGPVAYARYRLPAEPFLLILAGGAVVSIASWCRKHMQKS